MTQLLDNIRAVAPDNIKVVDTPYALLGPLIEIEYTPANHKTRMDSEYSITVTLGAKEWVEEELIKLTDGLILDQAVNRMKRNICELVYGKIRSDLLELHKELRREFRKQISYASPSLDLLENIIKEVSL